MVLNINLEFTDFCNARCKYCFQTHSNTPHNSPQGFMKFETLKRFFANFKEDIKNPLIYSLYPENFVETRISGNGEPMLHPEFLTFFKYVLSFKEQTKVVLTTNGSKLDEKMCLGIATSVKEFGRIVEINISIDAVTSDTYFKIKGLNELNNLILSIKFLLKLKKEMNLDNLKLILQYIVTEDNFKEADDFEKYWRPHFDRFSFLLSVCFEYPYFDDRSYLWFRKLNDTNNELHDKLLSSFVLHYGTEQISQLPTSDFLRKYFWQTDFQYAYRDCNFSVKGVCGMLWDAINLWWDGTIDPCCIDRFSHLKIGNINDKFLSEIFSGDLVNELKLCHLQGRLKNFPYCERCVVCWKELKLPRQSVVNYLNSYFKNQPSKVNSILSDITTS